MTSSAAPAGHQSSSLRADTERRLRERAIVNQFLESPGYEDLVRIASATASVCQNMQRAVAPLHSTLGRTVRLIDEANRILGQVMDHRRRVGLWISEMGVLRQPTAVVGLDEHLGANRRRSIVAVETARAYLRALTRRNCDSDPPGKLVSTHPQVTRGPTHRRLIRTFQPAAVLHV
ncbi:hypothetical protein ABIC28_003460 [Rhodococcus sp. PvR044]|jgi:hypothetical protein|uniref:hypothetical protein n=1 Tax=Rhodococcus sp. PvR044 TaxID=3156402 RepID=UPI0033957C7F